MVFGEIYYNHKNTIIKEPPNTAYTRHVYFNWFCYGAAHLIYIQLACQNIPCSKSTPAILNAQRTLHNMVGKPYQFSI